MNKPILCVDFDGVIHQYVTPWTSVEIISDGPVPGALLWLWRATEFFDVRIYSSRSKSSAGVEAMKSWLRLFSKAEFGNKHPMCQDPCPITFCHEKPPAFLTIDDRAICFKGDFSGLDPEYLTLFKPWNKP